MGLRNFFQTMLKTLNPSAYEELNEMKMSSAINYYFSMVLFAFIVMCILFLPTMFMLPQTIQEDLGRFNEFDIEITEEMNSAIYIPEDYPIVTIDTSKEYQDIKYGNLLVTKGAIFYKLLKVRVFGDLGRQIYRLFCVRFGVNFFCGHKSECPHFFRVIMITFFSLMSRRIEDIFL